MFAISKLVRIWILSSWSFLTIGILLGSWWAYHELGWGGWWFWDPVENASLMPWLLATACIHSVTKPKLSFWTLICAQGTFILSILGTFFVRSGLLSSVHSFATDSTRGLYLLLFLLSITTISVFNWILHWYRLPTRSALIWTGDEPKPFRDLSRKNRETFGRVLRTLRGLREVPGGTGLQRGGLASNAFSKSSLDGPTSASLTSNASPSCTGPGETSVSHFIITGERREAGGRSQVKRSIEQILFLQNFYFCLICVVVFCGTSAPLVFHWLWNRDVGTGAPFYNGTLIPLFTSVFFVLVYSHYIQFQIRPTKERSPALAGPCHRVLRTPSTLARLAPPGVQRREGMRGPEEEGGRWALTQKYCIFYFFLHVLCFHFFIGLNFLDSIYGAICFLLISSILLSRKKKFYRTSWPFMNYVSSTPLRHIILTPKFQLGSGNDQIVGVRRITKNPSWWQSSKSRCEQSTIEAPSKESSGVRQAELRRFGTLWSPDSLPPLPRPGETSVSRFAPLDPGWVPLGTTSEGTKEERSAPLAKIRPLPRPGETSVSRFAPLNPGWDEGAKRGTLVPPPPGGCLQGLAVAKPDGRQGDEHARASRIEPAAAAHTGIALFIFGILFSNTFKLQFTEQLHSGSMIRLGSQICCLRSIDHSFAPTFHSICANLLVYQHSSIDLLYAILTETLPNNRKPSNELAGRYIQPVAILPDPCCAVGPDRVAAPPVSIAGCAVDGGFIPDSLDLKTVARATQKTSAGVPTITQTLEQVQLKPRADGPFGPCLPIRASNAICMFPEKRFYYSNQGASATKVSIHSNLFTDFYSLIGTGSIETGWFTTVMKLPFIFCIWLGFMFGVIGGFLSLKKQLKKYKLNWL